MNTKPAVLIFDGDCGFCTSSANFIAKHTSTPIEIHPWQFIDVSAYGLTEAQVSAKVYMIVGGRAFGGHEGFAQILLIQRNWLFKTLGWLAMRPPFSWLARPVYWLVARFRHNLPGGTPACRLEPPKAL
jgi:predicted DCC family thiol-disulfide oxidoreductase YuxK